MNDWDSMINSPDLLIRCEVAKEGTDQHRDHLLHDKSTSVRLHVAWYGNEDHAKGLLDDKVELVRQAAGNRLKELGETVPDDNVNLSVLRIDDLSDVLILLKAANQSEPWRALLVPEGITFQPPCSQRVYPEIQLRLNEPGTVEVQVSSSNPKLRAVLWFKTKQSLYEIVRKANQVFAVMLKAEEVACQNPNADPVEILSQAGVTL